MSAATTSFSSKGITYIVIAVIVLLALKMLWPFYSVPTGSRGVVTQFGRIVGIENEGLAVLPRLAAENRLKTVESEQKQKVAVAEAEASAVRARADGDAYASLKVATAQAEALKIQNAALAQNKDVLELRRIEVERVKAERWNGQLPQNVYAGAPIPFFNVGH